MTDHHRDEFEAWASSADSPIPAGLPWDSEFVEGFRRCWQESRRIYRASEWRPIETAPEHKEVLLYREDAGVFTGIFTAAEEFLSDSDAAKLSIDDLESQDWFGGDYTGSWRLDGDEKPTHWQPLPAPPLAAQMQEGETP